MPDPKTILCYGDSNTWGSDPLTGDRFRYDVRWPGILQKALGDEFRVIEEGLPGRTTVWPDPLEGFKSGKEYLIPCLESHRPLDLVIILLGTNDLKARFSLPAQDIANGAGVLVRMVFQSATGPNGKAPAVLLISPPPVQDLTHSVFEEMFAGAEAKSHRFSVLYREVASQLGCAFLDGASVVQSSTIDRIHWEAAQHAVLGETLAGLVRQLSL